MNQFVEIFGNKLKGFWEEGSEIQEQLVAEVRQYAISNPQSFIQDLREVQFNKELSPLPIVLEALSTDTDNWGQFYVDTLGNIFDQATQVERPQDVLNNLMEFAYIEKDHRPFVQSIVDRLYKETNSDHLSSKIAAIRALPDFFKNPSIRNKPAIIDSLQQMLHDTNWKVRYVAFESLGWVDLVPAGHKVSFFDRLRKLVFGAPPTF